FRLTAVPTAGAEGRSNGEAPKIICKARGLTRMPLSPEQEALCERVEKGEPEPGAAALIRQQAQEIDALWDRLSHAYALVRRESPAEMIQEEMEALRAMLDERRRRVRPEWPYAAAREQILSDEGGGCSVASEVAG